MQITFGKFQGWDTEKLAQTSEGRSYLKWGAENLRSPKWAKEFQRVLSNFSASNIDVMAEAKAILANSPEIGWDEAETVARVMKEEAEHSEAVEDAYSKAEDGLRQVIAATGATNRAVSQVMRIIKAGNFEQSLKNGDIQFSNPLSEKIVMAAVTIFEKQIDGLDIW